MSHLTRILASVMWFRCYLLDVPNHLSAGSFWHPTTVRVPGCYTRPGCDKHRDHQAPRIVSRCLPPLFTLSSSTTLSYRVFSLMKENDFMCKNQAYFLHRPCRSQRESGTLTTQEVKATHKAWLLPSICIPMMRLSSTPSILHLEEENRVIKHGLYLILSV